ncbi:MAG: RNA methyltransferase [Pseudomonadota bacterium]|nr:RNA methyltransferase [Pseudomonadota bacterium]
MTDMPRESIGSPANPRFRLLVGLVEKSRERRRHRASVIEGMHLLESYVGRFGAPRLVFMPAGAPEPVARLAAASGAEVIELEPRLFARASQVENGPGPIAIIDTPFPALPDAIDEDVVYLDRIQDPGNVGSILRTCAAVGLRRIVTAPGTAFCWAPKVLRSGQGAHFQLDIHEDVEWAEIGRRARLEVRYAAADAVRRIDRTDLVAPAVWVFGNEGDGVAATIRESAPGGAIAIAQTRGVESLNVGVAAAICLYEQWRQRGFPGAFAAADPGA